MDGGREFASFSFQLLRDETGDENSRVSTLRMENGLLHCRGRDLGNVICNLHYIILYIIYNYILQCIIFQQVGKLFPNIPHQETLLGLFSFYLIKYL